MKLLLVLPAVRMSVWDVATGLQHGLEAEGHEVVPFNLAQRLDLVRAGLLRFCPPGHQPDEELVALHASEALLHAAVSNGCRWVLVVTGAGLHPDALVALRRCGIRIALRATESPYDTTDEQELGLAALSDVVFSNERTTVRPFQAVLDAAGHGGQAVYLAHAYDPLVHTPGAPVAEADKDIDVLLVGSGFAERVRLLESIDWTGIRLELRGLWPAIQPPSYLFPFVRDGAIANDETAALYRRARIVLNPYRTASGAESANPRTFEAAAIGAFQISETRAETAELLPGCVPTYEAGVPWQLIGQVRRWLADPAGRAALASEAQRRIQPYTFAASARALVGHVREIEGAHIHPHTPAARKAA